MSFQGQIRMLRKRFRLAVAALATAAACDGGSSGPSTPVPARLGLAVAPDAAAASGVVFPTQPIVQVLDATGEPVAARSLLITVTIASGGGTLGGTTGIRTDANGRAAFTDLVLTGAAGPRTLRFSSDGLSSVLTGAITLGAGPVAQAAVAAGGNQTAPAGTAVPVPPAIRVTDASGNPVAGVAVTFAVTSGGGSVDGAATVTNANGVAEVVRWVLGQTVGANALTATVTGIATPLVISATGVVGPAASLTVVEGDGQSATIGTAVEVRPAVRVADAFDNVIAGLSITFTVASGGGSVGNATAITDAGGVARVASWQLGLAPGENVLTASREGVPSVTITATALDFPVDMMAAGNTHTCALGPSAAFCWGDNSTGQMGTGTVSPDSVPVTVTGGLTLTLVTSGGLHTCGLDQDGAAWCWGGNGFGQLGAGAGPNQSAPVAVPGGHVFSRLAAGALHTCGVRIDGAALCWGAGANGRLGNGTVNNFNVPTLVAGGHLFTAISAGSAHTCGLRTDQVILCWGAGANGRLGDGDVADRGLPTPIAGGGTWTAVAAGGAHTCAVNAVGAAFCWGANGSGQLGTGTVAQQTVASPVTGGHTFATITTGAFHSCGLAVDGVLRCWGNNGSGRLGDGTTTARLVPTAVAGPLLFTAVSAGGEHTCARAAAGSGICWGRNAEGQIGDGTKVLRSSPVGVKAP